MATTTDTDQTTNEPVTTARFVGAGEWLLLAFLFVGLPALPAMIAASIVL